MKSFTAPRMTPQTMQEKLHEGGVLVAGGGVAAAGGSFTVFCA